MQKADALPLSTMRNWLILVPSPLAAAKEKGPRLS